ncbi:Fe-S protein assembly co-chaperone HscB [Paludibacterium paludis]|uniref:Co-chaperone protein HscB homolog n=1 Tax=Paludibacterium paludis TaxID=1225769 RepID=A0A918NYS4_9NEIS|nr:Fe-S protein assembly co-chaperone HscB [Paludibacterium paludis]GGY07553.1 co-chaperone protein HscB [Paludibacterium paludis]
MDSAFTQDYFALFGLERRFRIEVAELERARLRLAMEVHPDRNAAKTAAEQRVALMMATRVNEAYDTLKTPLGRARYLLELAGIPTLEETNTSMPAEFLIEQMQWRERIEEAADEGSIDSLDALSAELAGDIRRMEEALANAIDDARDLDAAALLVRKLRFLEKLEQEIGDAIEAQLG